MKTFVQFLNEGSLNDLDAAKNVIATLRKHGFQGYLVGGCVRDMLLQRQPKDIDVATDATPDQVISIFPGSQLAGKKFGVVIANGIDVATFRRDGKYSDGRRPDTVDFAKTPQEDAARRDFTVNALFMDPFTGDILDFFGGQEDLKNKLIRAVGNAHDRFTQDHLRIMRADRFAGRYGFMIHPDTEQAMKDTAHHLKDIDIERISNELIGSMGHDAFRTVTSMNRNNVLATILPEVAKESQADFDTTMKVLACVKPGSGTNFGMTALLFKLSPSTIKSVVQRMKLTNEIRDHVLGVLALLDQMTRASMHTSMDVLKKLMRDRYFPDALKLFRFRVQSGDMTEYAPTLHFLSSLYDKMTHEDLNPARFVTGDDLIAMGMKPGKQFKDILDDVENKQLRGELKSRDEALEFVRRQFDGHRLPA